MMKWGKNLVNVQLHRLFQMTANHNSLSVRQMLLDLVSSENLTAALLHSHKLYLKEMWPQVLFVREGGMTWSNSIVVLATVLLSKCNFNCYVL